MQIHRHDERGIALIAALMVMLLMSALMIAFTTIVMSDQRYRGIDKDRTRAYYGAQSGLEKLTVDLGNLFLTNVAPTNAQIAGLSSSPPAIPDITFVAPAGVTAYGAALVACDNQGNTTCNGPVQGGAYQGLIALKKAYNLDVVAKTTTGGEVHLIRKVESVAIPVFQFGMFSDVDLSFFAGPNFNFGGRVHTNGNLFLAEGDGSTLTLTDKVTAVKEIVRQRLQNGVTIGSGAHSGTVSMATSSNSFRPLLATEGSVQDGLSPIVKNPSWSTTSLGTYNGYIRNGTTGAKPLNLALVIIGGANTDMVRRPVVGENVNDPILFGERMFPKVSLRILLSDTAAEITNLPTVTSAAPVQLTGNWAAAPPAGYGPVDATHPAIARSPGTQTFTIAQTNGGATNINIGLNVVPAGGYFQAPTYVNGTGLQIFSNLNAFLAQIDCTVVTATQFQNCTNHAGGNLPAIAANSIVKFGNTTLQTTVTGAVTAGTPKNYTVTSTSAWAQNTFWMQDTGVGDATINQWFLVTCQGVNGNPANTLTLCSNVPKTAAAQVVSTNAIVPANTDVIGGFLKIEMQDTTGAWRDVTTEILNWGFADTNQNVTAGNPSVAGATARPFVNCGDPTPNAIVRFQRLKDNAGACKPATDVDATDFIPNALFDPREGLQRDTNPGNTNVPLGGLMQYVTLDVTNLSKWLRGTAPYGAGSGVSAYSNNGYGIYFSDRRNNRNLSNVETGEYGFEDVVNPASATGTPNGALDAGEDVNNNGIVDVYGAVPSWGGARNAVPPGGLAPYNAAANVSPTVTLTTPQAFAAPQVLFRRALKLTNGSLGNIVTPGLTVVAENPIYIQGNWNANAAGWGNPHAETAVIADAVTLLSNEWTDANSFQNPYNPNNRARATQAWYRLGVIGGKGPAFVNIAGTPNDFGTDGGAHNFLRYLESGQTVNYQGAIATFYFNRQATGTFKCCTTVYGAPTRNYLFDTDFLNPATLPPLTPVFRDLNALGFAQETRPGK